MWSVTIMPVEISASRSIHTSLRYLQPCIAWPTREFRGSFTSLTRVIIPSLSGYTLLLPVVFIRDQRRFGGSMKLGCSMIDGIGNYGTDSRTYLPTGHHTVLLHRPYTHVAETGCFSLKVHVSHSHGNGLVPVRIRPGFSFSRFLGDLGLFRPQQTVYTRPIRQECRFWEKRSICISCRLNFTRDRERPVSGEFYFAARTRTPSNVLFLFLLPSFLFFVLRPF